MGMRFTPACAGLLAFLALAGCESIDDKVERLYSEAQELAVSGEPEKARLVLRNLFDLDGYHRDARLLYAEQSIEIGDVSSAYRHYLLVAEQYPEYEPVRVTLAQIAAEGQDWDTAERHILAAEELGGTTPELRALRLGLDYRDAVSENDDEARRAAAEASAELLEEAPETLISHRLIVDNLLRDEKPYEALEATDRALEVAPSDPDLNRLKLSLLVQTNQSVEVGEHLKTLVSRFPESDEYRASLISWYLNNDDTDGAEGFLRSLITPEGEDTGPQFALIQFLRQMRSPEAALEQLNLFIAEAADPLPFERLKAAIEFDTGDQSAVIARVEGLIANAEPSTSRRELQITLARMYIATEEIDKAKAVVDQVLTEDDKQVDALVMRAGWLVEDDQVRDAILLLRTALDQSPQNVPAINMLAAAYERDGNRDLMGESLLLAATTSGYAPGESLRYARFLVTRDKMRAAEDILLQSLRRRPTNIELLQALGEVYLALSETVRVEQVVARLKRLEDNPRAKAVATSLQATLLSYAERTDESIELLQGLIAEGSGGLAAHAAVVRAHLANGDLDSARNYIDGARADAEEGTTDTGLEFIHAALLAVEGDNDGAKEIYRTILDETPESELVWRALIVTTMREGTPDAMAQGKELLDEALTHVPGSATLQWMQASLAERDGRVDDAIAIYEQMYEANSASSIVANNLASLITTHRDDAESLQRAYVIARRLRGSTLPAFRDTYGWIAYRMGNLSEAEEYLITAAQGLPADPFVQYHLGKVYAALDKNDRAKTQFEKAVALWQDTDVAQARDARAELQRLAALPAEGAETPDPSEPVAPAPAQ